jgi:hypothetical protein
MLYFFTDLVEEVPRFSFDPKIHPKNFEFKEDIVVFRKKFKTKTLRMPVSSASPYPIQGFNFNPDVRTIIKKNDVSPHPSGSFRFQDKYIAHQAARVDDEGLPSREPRANVRTWPVVSYDFPETTKSVIKEWKATPLQSARRYQVQSEAANDASEFEAVTTFASIKYESNVEALATPGSSYSPVESEGRATTSTLSRGWATSPRGSYLDSLSSSTMLNAYGSHNDCRRFVNWRN